MAMKHVMLLVSTALLIFGCKLGRQEQTSTAAPTPSTTQAAPAPSSTYAQPVPAPASVPAPAPQPAGAVLASQETNWKGIVAEVTEFRRKGNTLTAKVRLSNRGSEAPTAEIMYNEVYLIDTGAGKKYNVLKDEKGAYIAALHSGWSDRWYDQLKPAESFLLWIKFPAPPAEVRTITLQLPGAPPFEDLAIQD